MRLIVGQATGGIRPMREGFSLFSLLATLIR